MLEIMLKAIDNGNPRVLVNWDKYVMMLKLRSQIFITRFLNTGFNHTQGTQLLKHILDSDMTQNALRCKSDYSRYVNFIDPAVVIYRNLFDPVYRTSAMQNVFTGNNVPEIILNVSMDKPLLSLPLDKPWEYWKDYAPVRILYHDSNELISDLYKFRLEFTKYQPSCIFYSIDIVLLIFKYIKYLEHCTSMGIVGTAEDFIQQHVLIYWFEDLRRIWLFQLMRGMLQNTFNPTMYHANELMSPSSSLKNLALDLHQLLDACRKKSIGIGDICATKWFGDYSLKYWLNELNLNLKTPTLRQYKWIDFTSNLDYVSFLIDMMQVIDRKDLVLPIRNLTFELHQYANQNICSNIQQPGYRAKVQRQLNETISKIDNMGVI